MISFLQRQPFILLGAIGLVSLVDGLVDLPSDIGLWIDAWQAVTRPIWNFLLGWLFAFFSIDFPWWVADYLTLGFITLGSGIRVAKIYGADVSVIDAFKASYLILIWPYLSYLVLTDERRYAMIFLESFVWAAIIIAIAYATIFF